MFFKKIAEMVSSERGAISSLRVVFVLFAVAFTYTYIHTSIVRGEMQPLPESVLGVIVSLLLAKVVHKRVEKQEGEE